MDFCNSGDGKFQNKGFTSSEGETIIPWLFTCNSYSSAPFYKPYLDAEQQLRIDLNKVRIAEAWKFVYPSEVRWSPAIIPATPFPDEGQSIRIVRPTRQ